MCSFFSEEEPLVLEKLNTSSKDTKSRSDKIINPTKGGKTSDKIKKDFFGTLDCDFLQKVVDYYKMDIELFGYETDEHFSYCKNAQE